MSRYTGATIAPATATGAAATTRSTSGHRQDDEEGDARYRQGQEGQERDGDAAHEVADFPEHLAKGRGWGELAAWLRLLYECAGTGSGPAWTRARRSPERRSTPVTSAPAAKMPADHQKAVV